MTPRISDGPVYRALELERHQAEVTNLVNKHFPDSEKVRLFLLSCEEHRPLEVVERLRQDTREAWKKRVLLANAGKH